MPKNQKLDAEVLQEFCATKADGGDNKLGMISV